MIFYMEILSVAVKSFSFQAQHVDPHMLTASVSPTYRTS